jgi:hypothetical protein
MTDTVRVFKVLELAATQIMLTFRSSISISSYVLRPQSSNHQVLPHNYAILA